VIREFFRLVFTGRSLDEAYWDGYDQGVADATAVYENEDLNEEDI